MKWERLPPLFRNPLVLLRLVVVVSFLIIIGGLVALMVQDYNFRQLNTELNALRVSAGTLGSLSKDLLITNDLQNTFDKWSEYRLRITDEFSAVLSNPTISSIHSGGSNLVELNNTERLFELLRPRIDEVQANVELVIDLVGPDLPGLYQVNLDNHDEIVSRAIQTVTNFSLYSADLLNVRTQTLVEDTNVYATWNIRFSIAILLAMSVMIWVMIMLVIQALQRATSRIREANLYLEGTLEAVYKLSGQGFLSFDRNLKIDTQFSKQSDKLVGSDPSGQDVAQLLWDNPNSQREFRNGMELIFKGKARPDVVFGLFDPEIVKNDLNIRINFQMLPNQTVMLALTDVSREHRLKAVEEAERHRRAMILNAAANRLFFADFIHQANELFALLSKCAVKDPDDAEAQNLLRFLHTFKGNAGFFKFASATQTAHELEFHISDNRILGQAIDYRAKLEELRSKYATEIEVINSFLGASWVETLDSVMVPRAHYFNLEKYIKLKYGHDHALVSNIVRHRLVPLRDLFARYPDIIESVAQQLGKRIHAVQVEGGFFNVLPERFEPLVNSLVHIARNMVDHGIESSGDRDSLGKSSQGTIAIRLSKDEIQYSMVFSDDGRGIDVGEVRSRAIQLQLIGPEDSLTEDQVFELLFRDGFSTSRVATEISGRGIGLSAVMHEVKKLNGTIQLNSRPNRGTEFKIEIPIKRGVK